MPFRGHVLITDFSSGELSPRWRSRVQGGERDPLQGGGSLGAVYSSGCEELTNMVVVPEGGVVKRPGFKFRRDLTADFPTSYSPSEVRLITFERTTRDLIVILTPGEVRVYVNGGDDFLLGPIFLGATPYAATPLRALEYVQIQDSLVFLHPDFRPRVLRVRSESDIKFEDTEDTLVPPVYDFRDDRSPPAITAVYDLEIVNEVKERRYTPAVSGVDGQRNSVSAFQNDPIATLNSLRYGLGTCPGLLPNTLEVTYTGSGTDFKYRVQYDFIGSIGDGTGRPVLDSNNQSSTEFAEFTAVEGGLPGSEPLWSGPGVIVNDGRYYECTVAHLSAADNEPGVGANWEDFWVDLGVTLPIGTDYTELDDGVWTLDRPYGPLNRGWPSTGAGHEQRTVLNGGRDARGVIAGSRIGLSKLLDFTTGTDDDDGFVFLLSAANGTSVQWLHSQKLLMVGTTSGLFVQLATPLTPTSAAFNQQSAYTSAPIPGLNVAGEVFYVERNRQAVRQVQYVNELDSWQATNLAIYAEHLFTPTRRVRDVTYHPTVDSVLWVTRDDFALIGFTYEKFYGVSAWHKHASIDPIASVETSFNGEEYELIALVERGVWNGSTFVPRLFLESFAAVSQNNEDYVPKNGEWSMQALSVNDRLVHLDSYEALTGDGSTTLTVPGRFANRTIDVVENGVHLGDFLVAADSTITLPEPTIEGSVLHVGFNYVGRLRPNRLELAAGVTSQSQKIRWTRPQLRLFASALPQINGRLPPERSQQALYNEATGLYTGDIEVANLGSDGGLDVVCDLPLPYHITGVFGLVTLEEG